MKITSLEPFILHVPVTRGGIADATHSITHWGMPGVVIHADDGLKGYGYTGTHAHHGSDRLITDAIVNMFGPLLIGEDPRETESLFEKLNRFPVNIWIGRAGVTQLALSAIDLALWDLKAKATSQPLWRLLGDTSGDAEKQIEAYNTDGGWLNWSKMQLVEDCQRMIQGDGFGAVKMKMGKDDPGEDIERLAAVREAIGAEARLMVDVNGRWDLSTAVEYGGRLAEFDVTWLEEPLWHDDVVNHARLAEAIETPIALGEMLYNVDQFREFIAARAVRYVQPDVVRVGGVTAWRTIADLVADAELILSPHHGDMMQAQLHLCIAHRAGWLLEFIPWALECFEEPARVNEGFYVTPQMPGAGTTITSEAMAKFNVLD